MAKGDSKKAQNQINTQGGIMQSNLNKLGNQYDYLAYGPQSVPLQTPKYGQTTQQAPKQQGGLGASLNRLKDQLKTTTNVVKGVPNPGVGQYASQPIGVWKPGDPFPTRPATVEEAVALANQIAYGGNPQNTVQYWTQHPEQGNMWEKDPEYTWRRMLGEFGGGKDVARGGPFAGQDFGPGNTGGGYLGGLQGALGGYADFARTGGFSPQDIANIRARANAPIKALYSLGRDELERHKNISGGYMPNYAPALANMNRNMNYAMGDVSLNTEAMLAEQIRSGRLAGLGGQANLGLGLGGQNLQLAGLQNQLGLGLINAQLGKSQIPGDFSQAMANVGQVVGMVNPLKDLF